MKKKEIIFDKKFLEDTENYFIDTYEKAGEQSKESVNYLKAENKQLREDIEMLLERERRVRNDILFSLIISLIGIVVLFILSLNNK